MRAVVQLSHRLRTDRFRSGVIALVLSVPLILNAARALSVGWFPTFDVGFLQIRALDVGTGRTPLVGMPSTLSDATGVTTFHPGPLQSWLSAIPMRIFSFTPSALLISQVLLNIGWVVLAGWMLARSRWAHLRAVTLAAGLLFLTSLGPEIAHDPWNPHSAVIPLAVALLATMVVLAGQPSVGWVAVLAGSFAAQCHLSFAAAGALTVVVVMVVLAVNVARDEPGARRSLVTASIVFVLCWIGPLLDQFAGHGNLARLLGGGGTGITLGWAEAWSRFVKVLLPWRLYFDQRITTAELIAPVFWWESLLTVLIVIGALGLLVNRRGFGARLALFIGVVMVAQVALTAVMPVTMGTVFGLHLVRVWWPVVTAFWVCAIAGVTREVMPRLSWRRTYSAFLVLATSLTAVSSAVLYSRSDLRDGTWYRPTREVAEAIADSTPTGRYDLVISGRGFEAPLPVGVTADLLRRGYDIRVDAMVTPGLLDDAHRASADPSDGMLTLVVQKVGEDTAVTGGELLFADTFRVREWSDVDYEVFVYLS